MHKLIIKYPDNLRQSTKAKLFLKTGPPNKIFQQFIHKCSTHNKFQATHACIN